MPKEKKKKKRKKEPEIEIEVETPEPKALPKPKPKPKPERYDRDVLEQFAKLVDGKLGGRVILQGWNSDYEKLVEQGLVKYVERSKGIIAWLTPKGFAELSKKR